MNPEDRFALLQQLTRLKPGDPRATAILKSLQVNTPQWDSSGSLSINNRTTGINASMRPFKMGGPQEFGFSSTSYGMDKPGAGMNSRLDQLGIRATIYQLLDEIPTARKDGVVRKGSGPQMNRGSYYSFTPIRENTELTNNRNQRAAAYRRFTNGAFRAQQIGGLGGAWEGQGERISQDQWQPRDMKTGRVQKYVKFDPTKQDNILRRIADQAITRGSTGLALGPAAPALLTLDGLVEGATGEGLIDRALGNTQKALEKMFIKQPDINIGPILPF